MSPVAENEMLFSANGFWPVSGRPVAEHSLVHSAELVEGRMCILETPDSLEISVRVKPVCRRPGPHRLV